MKIEVINKYHGGHELLPNVVNIMRPNVLGNPFKIDEQNNRIDIIAAFDEWLEDQLYKGNQQVIDALDEIAYKAISPEGVHLLCCCAPKTCHGHAIKRYVQNALTGKNPSDH